MNLLPRPLLAEIRRTRPDWECVISATSVHWLSTRGRSHAEDSVSLIALWISVGRCVLPVQRIRPDCLVLAGET